MNQDLWILSPQKAMNLLKSELQRRRNSFSEMGDSDWMALAPPVSNSMPLETLNDSPEDMIAGKL